MKRSVWRPIISVLILAITIGAFIVYFAKHPSVRHQLAHVSPSLLISLLALYAASIVALAMVTIATVRLCRISLPSSESVLITMYAAIINFFGPLQSGPAFRAVYLKKQYDLNLKRYGVATLMYYALFGSMNVVLLFSGIFGWWLVPLITLVLLCAFAVAKNERFNSRFKQLDLHNWYYLALATLVQIVITVCIYAAELHSVAPATRLSQAVVYTGAANLSLFVSLTPGAIGFRESFLLLSKHLHHISNGAIVSANIIDRAVYITLLLLLALIVFGTHARRYLQTDADSDQ